MLAKLYTRANHRILALQATRGFAKKAGGFKAAGKSKAAKREGGEGKGMQDTLNRFVEVAEEAKRFKPEYSEEELAEHSRIAKEYQRQSQIRHNQMEKDISTKIWLQQEALRAIPTDMYEACVEIDDTPPPANRPWPFFATPPVEDFNPRDYMKTEDDDDDDEHDSDVVLEVKN